MKDEFPSIIEQTQSLDPTVIREQRMQELKNIADYRRQRLDTIKEWSKDPAATRLKIEAKGDEVREALQAHIAKKAEAGEVYKIQVTEKASTWTSDGTITEVNGFKVIAKAPIKLKWYQKLMNYIKELLNDKM